MRRKSRIMLCFSVLWVLGIAYYFYSGTALSRKVRFSAITCAFSTGYTVRLRARVEQSEDRAVWFGAAASLFCPDDARNVIKGLLVSVGWH